MKDGRNTCLNCGRRVGTPAGGWFSLCKHRCTEGRNQPYLSFQAQELYDGIAALRSARIARRPRP